MARFECSECGNTWVENDMDIYYDDYYCCEECGNELIIRYDN